MPDPKRFVLDGRTVTIYAADASSSERASKPMPLVISTDFEEDGSALLARCHELNCPAFDLVIISGLDWDRELSPWPANKVFKQGSDFAGGAPDYLRWLLDQALPCVVEELGADTAPIYLIGYSMAGLFSLWAAYQSPRFAGVACVSGSLWFPGFADYAASHEPTGAPSGIYLSLGSKESGGRNPVFRQTESIYRKLETRYQELGFRSIFELNPGNHFTDPGLRVAKGIAWLLGQDQRA